MYIAPTEPNPRITPIIPVLLSSKLALSSGYVDNNQDSLGVEPLMSFVKVPVAAGYVSCLSAITPIRKTVKARIVEDLIDF